MKSKKTADGKQQARKKAERKRALALFPTDIWSLSSEACAGLSFKPDGMAETILQALKAHGVEAGEGRKKVMEEVKSRFAKAADANHRIVPEARSSLERIDDPQPGSKTQSQESLEEGGGDGPGDLRQLNQGGPGREHEHSHQQGQIRVGRLIGLHEQCRTRYPLEDVEGNIRQT